MAPALSEKNQIMSYSISRHTRASFRDQVANSLVKLGKPIYAIMRIRRKPWQEDVTSLATYPENSLGNDLSQFLARNEFELMPRAEFHDVYHVLFEYGTSMREETAIQFVVIGNGRWSLPNLVSSVVAIVFYPEHWSFYKESYVKGKLARRFYDIDFHEHLSNDTNSLRKQFMD